MAPGDAALAAALNGNFRDSLASMKQCLATAAAAADASGGAGVAPPIVPAVLDLELSERQKMAGGSLLKMDDDSWAIVQVNRATVHDRGNDSIKWSIVTQVAGTAVLQPESWLSANVKQIVPGVLTIGAKKGAFAGELTIANVPVAITAVADPAGGTTFTHLKLSAHGMAEQIIDIDTAIGQIGGLRSQDWAGGGVPTPLHAGGGAATLADARVVSIPVEHFVGGGGSVAIKVAKLSLLNVAGPNVRCSTAATFLIGLTSASEVTDALAATLATNQAGLASFSAANAGAAASPQATAMVQARASRPSAPCSTPPLSRCCRRRGRSWRRWRQSG